MQTILLLAALLVAQDPAPAKGHLAIFGGGAMSPEMIARTLKLAGGAQARVLVIPQASEAKEAGQGDVRLWMEAGAAQATILDLSDAVGAVLAVEKADLVWIGGGQQVRLMKLLAGTGVSEAIARRYRAGAVVAGTSAGAAVMSQEMITGNALLTGVRGASTEIAAGLGLWPQVIVDQHFLARQRFNRLLSAVLDHPDRLGVGIDEGTGVIVSGETFEVIGSGGVIVLDARAAAREPAAADQPAAASGVMLHLLRHGMRFDFVRGKPVR